MYNVISSGSHGNCIIYHNSIMVDCGVPYSKIKPFISDVNIVLLTHKHGDHINIKTLKSMQLARPSLRVGCGSWMIDLLDGIRNIDILELGTHYDYGQFSISSIKLYHDVPNCGYRIFKADYKIIHCTDTAHLNGIEAKGYDLYAIEHNYNEDTIFQSIDESNIKGEFSHQKYSINSHLSDQQARDFIYKNIGETYDILRLHESTKK